MSGFDSRKSGEVTRGNKLRKREVGLGNWPGEGIPAEDLQPEQAPDPLAQPPGDPVKRSA